MSATQDYVALDWIKGEISRTLEQAQQALEAVAESPDDSSSMRACLTHLHQVHGTLTMVNLAGASQLSAEMEELAQALMGNEVPDVGGAQEVLMQAILQMPRYLDRIQREQRDEPNMVRPVVNNLRLARGAESLGAAESETADEVDIEVRLAPLTSPPTPDATAAFEEAGGAGTVKKLRARYQKALVALLRKESPRENLSLLGKVFTMLTRICGDSPMGNLSLLGLATIEGVSAGGIKLNSALAGSLKKLDAELRDLAASEDGLAYRVSIPLGSELLAAVDGATRETARIVAARARFAGITGTAEEDVSFGPDDETIAAVARILIEELAGITDKLDLYVRSMDRQVDKLREMVPQLEQISGTLSVVGLTQHMDSIAAQVGVIRAMEDEPSEEVLLDIARALLEIESSLKSMIGDEDEGDGEGFGSVGTAEATVIRETRNGLALCKDEVVNYVSEDFDRSRVESLPDSLMALRGGLLIINQVRAAEVLGACAGYARARMLESDENPAQSDMEDLADALTSVDYYLERYLESPSDPYLQMLEVAEQAITKLGFMPGAVEEEYEEEYEEDEEASPAEADAEEETVAEAEGEATEEATAPAADEVEEPAAVEAAPAEAETAAEMDEPVSISPAIQAAAEAEAGEVDEEILEIFIEEASEVLETIGEYLPQWQANTANEEALGEVRRAFHTLKGSGRMVGATVVGELAWTVEDMLNRVIDGTIEAGPAVLGLVEEVTRRLPEGVEAFKDGNQTAFRCDDLAARAEALSKGEAAPAPVEAEAEPEPIEAEAEPETPDIEAEAPEAEPAPEETTLDVELEELSLEEPADLTPEEALEEEAPAEEAEHSLEADLELEEIELESEELEAALEEQPGAEPPEVRPADEFDLEEISVEEESAEPALAEKDALRFDEDIAAPVAPETESEAAEAISELDEIFLEEAQERLGDVRAFLANPVEVTPELVAAFHTLKGSAGMAEVMSVSQVAGQLERLARQHYERSEMSPELIDFASRGATLIDRVLQDLSTLRGDFPDADALVAEMESAVPTAETATAAPSFQFENIRLLSTADDVLQAWDASQVSALVQELHEVVEQGERLGQHELLSIARALLGVYDRLQDRPSSAVAAELATAHEFLVLMFDQIASGQHVPDPAGVVERLESLEIQETPGEAPIEASAEVQADEAPVAEQAPGHMIELPVDEIDDDVLPLFLEEAEELVEEIDQTVVEWSADPSATEHLDNLLRQLHTLKGGARMSGLASLGEYAHNFETFLIGVQNRGATNFDEAFFALVNERQDEINRRVEIYRQMAAGTASEEDIESMRYDSPPRAGAAKAPAAEQPAPVAEEPAPEATVMEPSSEAVTLPEDEIDEDVLPIFLEEAEELVEAIDQSILDWSNEPDATQHLDGLLRQLHTLKGGSRMAGLASLGEFTHNLETWLIGIQQKPPLLDDTFFGTLNEQQDEISRRVAIYGKLAAGEATDEELASMRTAAQPGLVSSKRAASQAAPEAIAAGSEAAPAEAAPAKAEAAQSAGSAQQQEMVRVASDLLEELISLAGESSITRGRVEQQIADFAESLEEMEDTINRVREQVRRLEIEAESRETVVRTRVRDESDNTGFDDLEMDRYTMLQEISRALSEGMSDMLDLRDTLVDKSRDAETLLHQQARIGSDLQEGLTRTRMVPFARLIPRLRRIVRQVSGEVGKSVRFDAYNVEGELDRTVLERIVAPLEHMLRNAVDHGIESGEKRAAAGKPEQGRISLRLDREGGYVILKISDDGGGINVEAVKQKAIERGLMTPDQQLSDHEIRQFIMHAGFSTAQKLTQISGRGVGMDVVVNEIKALGGEVEIDSTFGVGTEFTIRLPFTVSINRALMVVIQDEVFAIPLNTIEGIVRVSPYELEAYYQPDAPMFEYAGQPYRLSYMGKLLDKPGEPVLEGQVAPLPVILARSGDHAVALQVDRVIGSREVVVKSLGPQFNEVGGVSGATVLGDGSVVVILDVLALVRSAELMATEEQAEEIVPAAPESRVKTVMIVDDSVTVRKVTSRLMERNGWEVTTAKDGMDALSQLQEFTPDIMLLDIEMPKMDGFEVLSSVRRDERLAKLPIIMITSRTGEKHKQRALELGVNRYLGKPFQEANLISTIDEVLAETGSS